MSEVNISGSCDITRCELFSTLFSLEYPRVSQALLLIMRSLTSSHLTPPGQKSPCTQIRQRPCQAWRCEYTVMKKQRHQEPTHLLSRCWRKHACRNSSCARGEKGSVLACGGEKKCCLLQGDGGAAVIDARFCHQSLDAVTCANVRVKMRVGAPSNTFVKSNSCSDGK